MVIIFHINKMKPMINGMDRLFLIKISKAIS